PRVWPASSRTVYRRTPRGIGGRTVTATSAQRGPSPERPAAARTRDPASPGPGVDAPVQRPPCEDRTPWRHDSRGPTYLPTSWLAYDMFRGTGQQPGNATSVSPTLTGRNGRS